MYLIAIHISYTDDDFCYSDSGKDASYQGKVNYARNFETCVPWDRVTNCTFHTFK
jgi:hypothetical protein